MTNDSTKVSMQQGSARTVQRRGALLEVIACCLLVAFAHNAGVGLLEQEDAAEGGNKGHAGSGCTR